MTTHLVTHSSTHLSFHSCRSEDQAQCSLLSAQSITRSKPRYQPESSCTYRTEVPDFLLAVVRESFSAPRGHRRAPVLWHSQNIAAYFFKTSERILTLVCCGGAQCNTAWSQEWLYRHLYHVMRPPRGSAVPSY